MIFILVIEFDIVIVIIRSSTGQINAIRFLTPSEPIARLHRHFVDDSNCQISENISVAVHECPGRGGTRWYDDICMRCPIATTCSSSCLLLLTFIVVVVDTFAWSQPEFVLVDGTVTDHIPNELVMSSLIAVDVVIIVEIDEHIPLTRWRYTQYRFGRNS